MTFYPFFFNFYSAPTNNTQIIPNVNLELRKNNVQRNSSFFPRLTLIGATGNVNSGWCSSRRSAMAATGKPISTTTKAVQSSTSSSYLSATEPYDFSPNSTPVNLVLSPDQLRHCSEALRVFKTKMINSPHLIREEFLTMQV